MKIIAAIDSFKGSMTSHTANQVVKESLPEHEVVLFPVADGGEGTVEAFVELTGGEILTMPMTNVNGKPDEGRWGWIASSRTAVIEAAEGAGLIKANPATLHPKNHTSFGMGEQIKQALDKGAKALIIGLGGTATVDGGIGMLQALGCKFYDAKGQELPLLPVDLTRVAEIDTKALDPRLQEVELIVASDVTNPLCGEKGAVYVFGGQKGLSPSELADYDRAMEQYSRVVERATGRQMVDYPGAGAAGGLGFAFLSFFDCRFESGFQHLAKQGRLEEKIREADVVVTGEGKFDTQSLSGKVPIGISRLAREHGIPTILFVGKVENHLPALPEENIQAIVPIVDAPMPLEEAMVQAPVLLSYAVKRAFRLIELLQQSGGASGK